MTRADAAVATGEVTNSSSALVLEAFSSWSSETRCLTPVLVVRVALDILTMCSLFVHVCA